MIIKLIDRMKKDEGQSAIITSDARRMKKKNEKANE